MFTPEPGKQQTRPKNVNRRKATRPNTLRNLLGKLKSRKGNPQNTPAPLSNPELRALRARHSEVEFRRFMAILNSQHNTTR